MIHILTFAELFSVLSLLVFDSIMNSKSSGKSTLKIVSKLVCYPSGLYVLSAFITALPMAGLVWSYQGVAEIAMHTAFHFMMMVSLLVALIKFADIPFNYAKHYLFARGALYFAFVFEVLALCAFVVCCVLIF